MSTERETPRLEVAAPTRGPNSPSLADPREDDGRTASPGGAFRPRKVGIVFGVGACQAGLAYLAGSGLLGPAVTGAVAVGMVAACVVAFVMHRSAAYLMQAYHRPIQQILRAVQDSPDGDDGARLHEIGAPIVQALARQVNHTNASVRQRERLSHANLMSVEMAFDRIHSVLHSLTEAVMLIDGNGKLVLANPRARALLRHDDRPLEGRPIMTLLTGELRDRIAHGMERGEELFQIMDLHVDERIYDLSIADAQSTRDGKAFGTVITLVDVTRNHDIARLKDEFLSSISHELRTPLTNICAFTEILAEVTPDNDSDWQEFLSIVGAESLRLKALVDDILQRSKVQTGDFRLDLERIDVVQLIGEALAPLASAAASSDIAVDYVKPDGELVAHVDRAAVTQVVSRVLDNALKFTPNGGRILVQVAEHDEVVEVSVEDSGSGIALEHRETVFESFQQIGDQLTEKPHGTGLGLAICRGLVDAMHGTMWCDDSELGGARFRFVLPMHEAALGPVDVAFGDHDEAGEVDEGLRELAAELAEEFQSETRGGSAGLWQRVGHESSSEA